MKYRSRTDIVREILKTVDEAGREGQSQTKIMYRAYLSYGQLKEYFAMMTANGLMSEIKNTKKFVIEPKGKRFLQISEESNSMIAPNQ